MDQVTTTELSTDRVVSGDEGVNGLVSEAEKNAL